MRLILLCMLILAYSQIAMANSIWLKDANGVVCTNTASTNAGQIVGLGEVNRSTGAFNMTIDNPSGGTMTCPSIGTNNNPISITGALATQLPVVHMLKPGTNNQNECLNQGNNLVGVTGSASGGTGTNARSIAFSFSFTDGCPGLPAFSRPATLSGGSGANAFSFTGTYYIYDINSVPEPGTIMLLLAGLFGLVAMSWIKRSKSLLTPSRG